MRLKDKGAFKPLKINRISLSWAVLAASLLAFSCATDGEVVQVIEVGGQEAKTGLDEKTLAQLDEIREKSDAPEADPELKTVIEATPNYSVEEYLRRYPHANNPMLQDYRVGGYDVIDITVYEEADLSREGIRVSGDGYISFPLIGRVYVEGLATSEIEERISTKLAEGQYLLDAHVSVTVTEFNSKNVMVLGSVKEPGTYSLQAKERVLEVISKSGGLDFEQGGKQGMIIRTLNPGMASEKKIVIRVDLSGLLEGGDQLSNLLMLNEDLLYIPKAENFYIIGQVKEPGSYPIMEKEITLVEAISMAGGFTPIAARNRTRVVRVEDGREKIYEIRVDAITETGKKALDVRIEAGDVIVVPESFF
jgi:polysaccharide export outer membrane protein